MITWSEFVKYLRKNVNATKKSISYLHTSRSPLIQLGGRSCIIFSFGIPMKMIKLIRKYLNETYSSVWVGKYG